MSKYTTEVRYICEKECGLTESVGLSDVDKIISESWNKIFTTSTPFFDETYRAIICKKILKHYYMREIGCEVVGLWKLWMNTRLEEIMPYYNKLYESVNLEFNPLYDTDITTTHNRKENNTGETTEKHNSETGTNAIKNGTANSNAQTQLDRNLNILENNTQRNLFSDTPQGALTGIESETYLTDARKITDNNNKSDNENANTRQNTSNDYSDIENTNSSIKNETNGNSIYNTTEDYITHVIGKQTGKSFSSMIIEYRNSLINVDMMLIDEFADLFMCLF